MFSGLEIVSLRMTVVVVVVVVDVVVVVVFVAAAVDVVVVVAVVVVVVVVVDIDLIVNNGSCGYWLCLLNFQPPNMQPPQTSTSGKLTHDNEQTVDGRNPAQPRVYNTL